MEENNYLCTIKPIQMHLKPTFFVLLLTLPLVAACSGRAGKNLDLHSEEDLTGVTISTTAGSYFDSKFSGREDVDLFLVTTETDGIEAVRQGIADVHATDEVAFSQSARERLGIKLRCIGIFENFFGAGAASEENGCENKYLFHHSIPPS